MTNNENVNAARGDRPATKKQRETLARIAAIHGRPGPKDNLTFTEAQDAIRWLATRRKAGQEFVPAPAEDPEMQPGMTLRHWNTERPNVRRPEVQG